MAKIKNVKGRQVFDSRGNPTVEAEIFLDNNISATAISPSGASTGAFEAHELRDEDKNKFLGKSVNIAVENINSKISSKLIGLDVDQQEKIDKTLLELDSSENKTNLGANATLAVSLANAKCSAIANNKSLFKNLGKSYSLPIPLMNIINGGAHADNDLNIQEFMIRPDSAKNFMDAIEKCFLVIQNLKKLLHSKKMLTNVGDEGGFAPSINTNEEALELIVQAIEKSKLKAGHDVAICLDVAANELMNNKGEYSIESKNFTSVDNVIKYYEKLTSNYPIKSIEDPFAEDDWGAWSLFSKKNKKIQVVGDDLYVTNLQRLKKGFLNLSSNAILIKLNQIGTVSETLEVIKFAQAIGYNTIISHRSGDSEDTFISDFAVGTNSNQIKTGSLCRSERVAKYNQLLRIENELLNKNNMAQL